MNSSEGMRGLNGNQLKLIAVITMLLDHIGHLWVGGGMLGYSASAAATDMFWMNVYVILRMIGRVAFPIYAFLLVEGFLHTRDWKRYAMRLGVFAVISEVPFDLFSSGSPVDWSSQNVFFTLLLGLLMLQVLEVVRSRFAGWSGTLLQLAVIVTFCEVAWAARTDYYYIGIILIALCGALRQNMRKLCLLGFAWMALQGLLFFPGYAAAFLILYRYNGQRGAAGGKYFFYLFYPVHLLLLYLIYRMMSGLMVAFVIG